jgi:hypothetical protein
MGRERRVHLEERRLGSVYRSGVGFEFVKKQRTRWICNCIYAYCDPALNSLPPPVRDSLSVLSGKYLQNSCDRDGLFNLQE